MNACESTLMLSWLVVVSLSSVVWREMCSVVSWLLIPFVLVYVAVQQVSSYERFAGHYTCYS